MRPGDARDVPVGSDAVVRGFRSGATVMQQELQRHLRDYAARFADHDTQVTRSQIANHKSQIDP